MRIGIVIFAFALLSCQQPAPRYIVTEGHSTIKAPIESMSLWITARSKNKSLKAANEETRNSVLAMFRTLKKFGIADSDFVTTSNTSSDRFESYRYDQMAEVQYSGQLKLRNPELFDAIFNDLASLGNVSVRIGDFHTSKIDDYTRQSYEASLKSARKAAELVLSGSGVRVGRILKVLKGRGNAFDEYDDFEKHIEKALAPPDIASQDIKQPDLEQTFRRKYFDVESSVTVMFELE